MPDKRLSFWCEQRSDQLLYLRENETFAASIAFDRSLKLKLAGRGISPLSPRASVGEGRFLASG